MEDLNWIVPSASHGYLRFHTRCYDKSLTFLNNLCTYTKGLMIFSNEADIHNDRECQQLRR